jgi:hypothetical protein
MHANGDAAKALVADAKHDSMNEEFESNTEQVLCAAVPFKELKCL